jgi:SET domain-containing protein
MKDNYCRLKPSLIEGAGVGVFAIERIPKGINPFPNCDAYLTPMSNSEFDKLSDEKKKMVRDFCYHSSGHWRVPQDFNRLDISWYVNSSPNPNLVFDTTNGQYKTIRDIQVGEELTYDYVVYE